MAEKCDGKRICGVYAKTEVFGDPCSSTKKYLVANWVCLKVEGTISSEGTIRSFRFVHPELR